MEKYQSQLVETTFKWIEENPEKKKIYDADMKIWLTDAQLLKSVEQALATMQDAGLETGDLLLLALPNSAAYVIVYLAAMKLGLDIYSMNPTMPKNRAIEQFRKRNYKAAVLTPDYAGYFAETAQGISERLLTKFGPDDTEIKLTLWQHIDPIDKFDMIPSHSGILMYTSGTTSEPKGVLLSQEQMAIAGENIIQSHLLTAQDRIYITLPFHHINAQHIGLISTLISGGSLIVQKHFSAHRFWPIAEEQAATWVTAAPAIISILLNTAIDPVHLTKMRFIRSASAPLPIAAMERFERRFGVSILNSYGMTEAPSQISIDPLPPLRSPEGSSGKPFNIKVRIANAELTKDYSTGKDGYIWIQGPGTISAYLHGRDKDSFLKGWFKTGDMGHFDADGFLYLVGRSKEMINKSGDKISPYEVENVIDRLDFIGSSAVVGYPDDIYGETVAAVIVLKTLAEDRDQLANYADQIRKIVAENEEKFKIPKYVFFMTELPHGATGKIQRTALKKKLSQETGLEKY
ncbi:MAG: AMP-binding protein [Oenococcus sp.]|uniref:AMP-binding protein n=1 Tax=Oenococcus TaxID=46254 RepID=UPI0021E8B1AE|nr:AMP-binding protein [Oenococcus kitaharae]MCV3296005.1 AMP-binding protein [Oenococcus kitaharae]